MKKFVISAAALAVAVVASATSAQAQAASVLKPVQLGVSLGAAIPQGDFGTAVKTGYNATASVALNPTGLPVGFRIDAGFNQFAVKGVGSGNANIFAVTGNVVLPFSATPMLAPYLIGGGGYYHESLSGSLGGGSENHPGFNVGGGVKIPLTGFDAFVEARYNRVSENGGSTSFIPITVGVLF